MADDEMIPVKARRLFCGPIFQISIAGAPDIPGMRFDGQRWVDETRPDRPMVPVVPQKKPEQWSDLVVARTPFRQSKIAGSRRKKNRRRGGF